MPEGMSAVLWLITLNAGIFIIILLLKGILWFTGTEVSGFTQYLGLHSAFDALLQYPWTAASYMITHIDALHLLFNMLWLYWFGQVLLLSFTPSGVVLTYICGGIAGAVFYLSAYAFILPANGILFGASASVLAVMTAAAFTMPDYSMRLMLLGGIKLKWLVSVCILLAFLGLGGGAGGGTAAHLGGACAGAICGLLHGRKITAPGLSSIRKVLRRRKARRIMTNYLADEDRMNQLLQKIHSSGFASLSRSERKELSDISSRLDN